MNTGHSSDSDAEELLDELDPAVLLDPAADASDLRAVALASDALDAARRDLETAVASARARGRTWAAIGGRLDISRQAAQQRFGHLDRAASAG